MEKKILVIDDNHLVAKSLSKLLENEGYFVVTVESGWDALQIISQENFDLIISDIRMPEIDGVETVEKIKQFLRQNNKIEPPIIFITGYAEGNSHEKAKKMKVSDFIYKPFDKELFLKSIEHAIENK